MAMRLFVGSRHKAPDFASSTLRRGSPKPCPPSREALRRDLDEAQGAKSGRRRRGPRLEAQGPHLYIFLSLVLFSVPACAPDPEEERIKATTKATYDKDTGRLTELTYDKNKDGVIDTWTKMDGTKILSSEIDNDQNGKIDRWEYYGEGARLEKVAIARANDGVPDMWLYPGADGKVVRAEISSKKDGKVDRWEWYESDALVRAEDDASGDGQADKWETFEAGRVLTASFDENNDGRPDRRLTYGPGGALVSIESDPDPAGQFRQKVNVRRQDQPS